MAEPKRIQLDAPKTLHREKKQKALPPTYRFELELTDIKNTDCAEYSYAELVKEARSSENDSKHPGSDDPFSLDDDDQKLQEIARRYEEKYNPKPGRKKKKKCVVSEDYIDKGMGYDETDPFIDNDEAYDELVPSTLTTQFGGFYINKGELEFRNKGDDGGYDSKFKKKRLKGMDKDGRKKRRLGNEENQKRRGRKPLHDSMSALIKPVKKTQPTVADMLQQQKAKLQQLQQEGLQQMELNPISVEREIEPEEVEENHVSEVPIQVNSTPGQGSTISEAIESVVKAAAEEISNESAGPITGSSDGEEMKPPVENVEAPKLPDNLPPELDDVVAKLKAVAFKSEEGKCKFFSDEVNRMLLSIELKAQELTSAQRSTIYSHLASHLPCTKETLQKRAKKLRLDQEDGKLREPMQRLRDGIAAVMPDMLEKYAARLEACNAKDEDRKSDNAAGGSDEDSQGEEGEKKPSRLPKKYFEWNDTIRKYLCDVVRIKLKCYEVSKTRIQSAEEYLKHFLEAEVKNLWPPGWMQSRILFRESRAAHFYITNRPKKQILVQKKVNNPLSTVAAKPAVSILNNTLTQESEFDLFLDKSVPLIPPVENALERRENYDLLTSNNGVSAEERAAEYAKLFTLPIQSSVPDDLTVSKNQETPSVQTNSVKVTVDPPSTSSPSTTSRTETVMQSKPHMKSEKHPRLPQQTHQQNKSSPFPPKVADYAAFAEGSLASDMLARIICASLADYPYSGSHNVESASKTSSVISSNVNLIKETHPVNSKYTNDLHTSPKKQDVGKSTVDKKKTSQEIPLHLSSVGINFESLLKKHNVSRPSDPGFIYKNVGLPSESSSAVNLKLKDTIVPHPRQFAEAFEKTEPPVSKKLSLKGHNVHAQNSSVTSSSSSRLNTGEHLGDYPSTTSPRGSLESAHLLALELANKYSPSTQGTPTPPYKKRTKYASSSSKINDPWTQLFDASVGSSLLEGMKGFPFPVSLPTSLPTPPPAHSSSPHRTSAHSQHNSPRTTSLLSPGLRNIHESKSDASSNHNSQTHPNIITVSDAQRRQSLIQGPWKSNPSPQSSTSLSHFMASTSPPISNQCKPTSPNHLGSNSHINMSPVPAHSMSQIDKVTTPFNRSHSPLPPRASPSPLRASPSHSALQTLKVPSSTSYSSHMGQASYSTHQSSHSVSQTIHQGVSRSNNIFDPSNTIIASSSTGTLNFNQEMKTPNPRTN